MRSLEDRLEMRLFHRNSKTKTISMTSAGAFLFSEIAPRFRSIDNAIAQLDRFRTRAVGRLRIKSISDASHVLRAEKIARFLESYTDIDFELTTTEDSSELGEYDAGICYEGDQPEGVVSTSLTADVEFVLVGSPKYFRVNDRPRSPNDLLSHRCIRLRAGHDSFVKWQFRKDDERVVFDVPSHLTLNDADLALELSVAGTGLIFVSHAHVADRLETGELETVLDDWRFRLPGFHIYHSEHLEGLAELRTFIDFIKDVDL